MSNKVKKKLAAIFLTWIGFTILLSVIALGCGQVKAVADDISFAVKTYCKLPESERAINRAVIDAATAPNQIRIQCAA